ncbi:MAG: 4'-phosphopantetheinyl transferase superfamily protein [Burkholderiaceae bacterium]|jgi:4'-phosphopantetheinyl transferase|nr:4'-phosphopantetheinyl transferase superfamily protein [Burkholderiaceae bacterium]
MSDKEQVWQLLACRLPNSPDADQITKQAQIWLNQGLVHEKEWLKARSYRHANDALGHLTGRAMLRHALILRLNLPGSEINLTIDEFGKPNLADKYLAKFWHFSISHTNGLAVCLLGSEILGVDVEAMDYHMELAPLAPRILTPIEMTWIMAAKEKGDATMRRRFLAIWTIKEAMLKATGKGLSVAPTNLSIIPDSGHWTRGLCLHNITRAAWRWQIHRLLPGFLLACASPHLHNIPAPIWFETKSKTLSH